MRGHIGLPERPSADDGRQVYAQYVLLAFFKCRAALPRGLIPHRAGTASARERVGYVLEARSRLFDGGTPNVRKLN